MIEVLSVFVYFFPFFFVFISLFISESLRDDIGYSYFCLLITIVAMFLILALRYDLGYDYPVYLNNYINGIEPSEPVSILLYRVAKLLGGYKLFFTVYAAVTIACVYYVAHMERNVWVVLMYLSLPWFFVDSFGLVRQSVAVGFSIVFFLSFKVR